jgi:hypothetical protein
VLAPRRQYADGVHFAADAGAPEVVRLDAGGFATRDSSDAVQPFVFGSDIDPAVKKALPCSIVKMKDGTFQTVPRTSGARSSVLLARSSSAAHPATSTHPRPRSRDRHVSDRWHSVRCAERFQCSRRRGRSRGGLVGRRWATWRRGWRPWYIRRSPSLSSRPRSARRSRRWALRRRFGRWTSLAPLHFLSVCSLVAHELVRGRVLPGSVAQPLHQRSG